MGRGVKERPEDAAGANPCAEPDPAMCCEGQMGFNKYLQALRQMHARLMQDEKGKPRNFSMDKNGGRDSAKGEYERLAALKPKFGNYDHFLNNLKSSPSNYL